ncbi:MAG: UDP-N-acetylmuramoyl-tripeptide--D-alanyl-D-alanine ligase [Gammaproteobacteria bacterium HGW-Gammaproteobacteria-14]|nr:MAG: UDP-N-acetylmuramoyl-tripeptide--D-alanyl-D-alanine ligase [Gammaproteobacteria bacterium HGW-Gammaproteobacteria-14]
MMLSMATQWCNGSLSGGDCEFLSVSTDTRKIRPGDLFVALRGERFDGHEFVAQAVSAGACAVMVERPTQTEVAEIVVPDSRRALGFLAAGWADQFSIRRIAVTGNAGKTTVKEMIARMLSPIANMATAVTEVASASHAIVHATKGNLNNEIGVPLTLLGINTAHQYGVFELGASAPGEIAWTGSLVKPEVVMVTNVTGAHLEGFGSMQGIADAKAEIFAAAPEGSLAVINGDDSFANFFAERAKSAGLLVQWVGSSESADWQAKNIALAPESTDFVLSAGGDSWSVHIPLPGAHQVSNALMAIAAVNAMGVSMTEALSRLEYLQPVKGRMNLQVCGQGMLMDDSYNANPGSVRAAIDWLAERAAPRMLVLGDLAELGDSSVDIHQQLGRYAASAGVEALVAVGEQAAHAARAFGAGAIVAASHDAAAALAENVLERSGTVLVKGSRSAGMEKVVNILQVTGEIH